MLKHLRCFEKKNILTDTHQLFYTLIFGKHWMRHIYKYAVDLYLVINLAFGVYKQ